jgi:hypothetical protein
MTIHLPFTQYTLSSDNYVTSDIFGLGASLLLVNDAVIS